MTHKKYIPLLFLLGAAFACVLSGCAKEVVSDETEIPIVFTAGELFTAETKASEVTTANLTSFYVTATRGAVGSSETETFTSATFTGTPGGTFSGGKWWPASNPSFHFYGSNIGMSFDSNACTVSASNGTDVVCAYLANPSYGVKNALTFAHIFARIGTCTVNAPSGFSISGTSVKITPKVSGTYNIRTGNGYTDGTGWSGTASGSETTLPSSNNNLYLVPGSYTLSVTYTLSKGDWMHQFTKNATVSVISGSVNNISMTVPSEVVNEIVISVSLSSWGTQNLTPDFI